MNYPSIRIEGAILTPDVIDTLENQRGQQPADFGFAPGSRVKDEIARAWADAQDYWRIFRRRLDALRTKKSFLSLDVSVWSTHLVRAWFESDDGVHQRRWWTPWQVASAERVGCTAHS